MVDARALVRGGSCFLCVCVVFVCPSPSPPPPCHHPRTADKAIKRYIRLMTVRIDWNTSAVQSKKGGDAEEDDEDEDGPERAANSCELVWTGVAGKRAFNGFKFEECLTMANARKHMHTHGLAHYWDMVIQSKEAAVAAADGAGAPYNEALAVVGVESLLAPVADSGDMHDG